MDFDWNNINVTKQYKTRVDGMRVSNIWLHTEYYYPRASFSCTKPKIYNKEEQKCVIEYMIVYGTRVL